MAKAKPRAKKTSALYLYAAGLRQDLHRALKAGGAPDSMEPGTPFALVTSGDLAAVVSEVHVSEEDDVLQLAEKLMRHERAAEYLAANAAVVPFRFGVMYSGREPVRAMLSERRSQIVRSLGRLKGCEEWGVNIDIDRQIFSEAARMNAAEAEVKTTAPGQAYLRRKKLERTQADESKRYLRQIIAEIKDRLKSSSKGSADLEIKPGVAASKLHPEA